MAIHNRSHWLSRFRKFAPLGLCLLLLTLVSCGDTNTTAMMQTEGPLVRIHVAPIDPNATQVVLSVTATDPTGMPKVGMSTFTMAPYDLLGVQFPIGTRGVVNFQVDLRNASNCLLSTGTAMLTINSDGVLELTVNVTPVPFCGNGATLSIQVANILGAAGLVESMPSGISCNGSGNGCTMTVKKGTAIVLKATVITGIFNGWSGGGCPTTGDCSLTLNQDTVVQAVFTNCRGWCRESIPAGISANFNGVGGTTPSNVLVVGDTGSVLLWDGAMWKTVNANVTDNLRAAVAKLNASTVFVAGDNGRIV